MKIFGKEISSKKLVYADFIVTIIGIALITFGIYQIYKPAAYIVLGLILAFPGIPKKAVK